MNFFFICGSLEPGKDGVGDYTRILAGELMQKNNKVFILAINDSLSSIEYGIQKYRSSDIPVLRLPDVLTWQERLKIIKEQIDYFNPDILSLQFVPFSFHPKGLFFGLKTCLTSLKKGTPWHIMIHELWAGMDRDSSFKLKTLGTIQKFLIKDLIKNLDPVSVTTHSQLYRKQLELMGIDAKLLPLFGNIPVLEESIKEKKDTIHFIIFGTLHQGANVEGFAKWLKLLIDDELELVIDFVGGNGSEAKVWIAYLNLYSIPVIVHGRQSLTYISKLMHNAHIGITTTPYLLTEKSGSVAAMLDHKLPVIGICREWMPNNTKAVALDKLSVIKWSESLQMDEILNSKVTSNTVDKIANLLLQHIHIY